MIVMQEDGERSCRMARLHPMGAFVPTTQKVK
jgi:hypothetical protein